MGRDLCSVRGCQVQATADNKCATHRNNMLRCCGSGCHYVATDNADLIDHLRGSICSSGFKVVRRGGGSDAT